MTNEEFLKDICPNHTDKSKWNKSELLHILDKYQALQLQQTGVIVQSEQLKTCEHNFADVYDHTGTQIIGKKCLNGCGF